LKFTIGFEKEDKAKLYGHFDKIIATERWSEGPFTELFEQKWAEYVGTKYAVAFSSWFGAAMAALEYFNVRGRAVICPSNTFMATPLSVLKAGGDVEFCDCNTHDLCAGLRDVMGCMGLSTDDWYVGPVGVFLVHIGGHIAFEVDGIAAYCRQKGMFLIEDCAHAHGAIFQEKKAGTFGDCGVYSFYATKTISTGEGGMLVTDNKYLDKFAREYRNYGKPDYRTRGGNHRMSEFTAALGLVQTERVEDIVEWKNRYVEKHYAGNFETVEFPRTMRSGYYKFIIFDRDGCYGGPTTGAVYDEPCHLIMNERGSFPATDWVAKNHKCLPIYYRGDE